MRIQQSYLTDAWNDQNYAFCSREGSLNYSSPLVGHSTFVIFRFVAVFEVEQFKAGNS